MAIFCPTRVERARGTAQYVDHLCRRKSRLRKVSSVQFDSEMDLVGCEVGDHLVTYSNNRNLGSVDRELEMAVFVSTCLFWKVGNQTLRLDGRIWLFYILYRLCQ